MMKRVMACLLAVIMVMTTLPLAVAADESAFVIFGGQEELRMPVLGYAYYDYSFADNEDETDVTWSVDNEGILALSDSYFDARQVGTVTLTATTENGLSDSITVTVYAPVRWGAMGTRQVYLNPTYPTCTFELAIGESGYYHFASAGDADPALQILDNDGNYLMSADDENNRHIDLTVYLEAGTYYLYMETYSLLPCTFEMTVEPMNDEILEGGMVAFKKPYMYARTGDIFAPAYVLHPSLQGEEITLTSSDESVVMVVGDGLITGVDYGSAVVTITTASGYTDTITVYVSEPLWITLTWSWPAEVTEDCVARAYCFVPETSGTYSFRSQNITSGDPYGILVDGMGNILGESDDNGVSKNFEINAECKAGELYMVYCMTYDGTDGQYGIAVSQPSVATELTLELEDSAYWSKDGKTYYVSADTYATATVEFGNTFGAMVQDVTLEVSDESVAEAGGLVLYIKKAGTITVTATAADGFSDTITLVALDLKTGDVTLDGKCTMMDVLAIYNEVGGNDSEIVSHGKAMADMTGDNTINMMDVLAAYTMISGQ